MSLFLEGGKKSSIIYLLVSYYLPSNKPVGYSYVHAVLTWSLNTVDVSF